MSIASAIHSAIWDRIPTAITQAGAGGWTPALWFLASEQGVWYDSSDTSAMFQDSAGTTPVTAVEQPVGLILDKRLGLVPGADVKIGGTIAMVGVATAAAFNTGTGVGSVSRVDASNQSYIQFTGLAASTYYRMTFSAVSGGVLALRSGASSAVVGASFSAPCTAYVLSSSIGEIAITDFSSGTTASFTLTSIRELPGNHATQATTAQKPAYRSAGFPYLGFDRVDDNMTATGGGGTTGILVCAAIRAGGAGNARTIFSDRGTNTGYRLSVNASNQLVLSAGNGAAHTEVVGPTITAGTDYVVTGWHDGANLNVQANAGAATSAAFGTATAGTAGFTIGKDNGAATGYYSERIYEIVYRKDDTSSAGDRTTLINYMAAQAGISL